VKNCGLVTHFKWGLLCCVCDFPSTFRKKTILRPSKNKTMGRPPTKPKRFKDGFYIEVRSKGQNQGMKIHFETEAEMNGSAEMYKGMGKEVFILGRHKKDVWLDLPPSESEQRELDKEALREAKRAAREQKKQEAEERRAMRAALRADKAAEKAEKVAAKQAAKAEKKEKAAKPAKKEKPVKKPAAKKPAKAAKAKPVKKVTQKQAVKKAKPAPKAKAKKKK